MVFILYFNSSTDFYHHQHETSQKVGFPAGVANEVVQKMFQRYENQTRYEEQAAKLGNFATSDSKIPTAHQEVEVTSEDFSDSRGSKTQQDVDERNKKQDKDGSEIHNGDDRGSYRWTQTIHDVDVLIPVSKEIVKAKQLKVKINPYHLKVETVHQNGNKILVDQTFPHRVASDESLWSLVAGEHVQVWNSLLLSEFLYNSFSF